MPRTRTDGRAASLLMDPITTPSTELFSDMWISAEQETTPMTIDPQNASFYSQHSLLTPIDTTPLSPCGLDISPSWSPEEESPNLEESETLLKRRDQNRVASVRLPSIISSPIHHTLANRNSQRAYRQRRMRLVQDLEAKLCEAHTQISKLKSANQITQASLQQTLAENQQLRAIIQQLLPSHIVHPGSAAAPTQMNESCQEVDGLPASTYSPT